MKAFLAAALMIWTLCGSAYAVGPITFSDADSTVTVRLQLAAQLQTTWENKDRGDEVDRDNAVYMKVRRLRPVMSVAIPEYRTSFRVHLNASPGAIELLDLQFDFKLNDQFQFRAGQYKIPFTRYRIQSFQRLTFVDWSIVTKYFGAERQQGFSVHNGYERPPKFGYVFGLFNGVNARGSHTTRLATLYGEKVLNRSDLSESHANAEFHPELVGHLSWNSDGVDVRSDTDAKDGALRYSVGSSVAWDLSPTRYEDLAVRAAQELLLKCHRWSLMTVGYVGFEPVDDDFGSRLAFVGGLVQTSYRASDRLEFSARLAHVDIDDKVSDAAYVRGQAIIAGTEEESVVSQYRNAGLLWSETEVTVGCNVYLDEHNLKVQTDVGFTRAERRDGDRTDVVTRVQIQLAF